MAELTEADVELLKGPESYATLVTLDPDGTPQASMVWIDTSDGLVLVNTAEGRRKARNLHRDGRVAALVTRGGDAYDWISITGTVVDTVGEPEALEHIGALSERYDRKPWDAVEGQRRVIFRIRPDRIVRYA
jgi:PPOX class probable F420-dependent enzyme